MMVIPNEGKLLWLYWALGTDGSDLEDFVIDLYQNDYTPVDASTGADFTAATFTGYSQFAVARADFAAPAIASNVAVSDLTPFPDWTCTGGSMQTCYGWYMRGASSGDVLAAERFATPRQMANGAKLSLDPFEMKLKSFA